MFTTKLLSSPNHLFYKIHRMPLTRQQSIIYKIGGENLSKIIGNFYHVNLRLDDGCHGDSLLIGGTMKGIGDSVKLIEEYFENDGLLKFTDRQILRLNDPSRGKDQSLCHQIRTYIHHKRKPFKTRKHCYYNITKSYIRHPCILCQLYLNDGYVMTSKDIDMLLEFICTETYRPFDVKTAKVCYRQHNHIINVLKEAQDLGKIPIYVPKPYEVAPEPPVITVKPKNVRYRIEPINENPPKPFIE